MLKVICINGVNIGDLGKNDDGSPGFATKDHVIYEGCIYTVIEEVEQFGVIRYILLEKGLDASYNRKMFIPLSDIDETELIKEREVKII